MGLSDTTLLLSLLLASSTFAHPKHNPTLDPISEQDQTTTTTIADPSVPTSTSPFNTISDPLGTSIYINTTTSQSLCTISETGARRRHHRQYHALRSDAPFEDCADLVGEYEAHDGYWDMTVSSLLVSPASSSSDRDDMPAWRYFSHGLCSFGLSPILEARSTNDSVRFVSFESKLKELTASTLCSFMLQKRRSSG